MSQVTLQAAIQHAIQAGRSNMNSIGILFDSIVRGEVGQEQQVLAATAGAGITGGSGVIYETSVSKNGGIITTRIMIDLTGLSSATSLVDIIGIGTENAHLGQITAARNGTIFSGKMTCLELPASLTDIDLYSAEEATGAFEDNESTLTATELLAKGGAWTAGDITVLTALPAADEYLYLMNGAADTADAFTAGRFLIEFEGYDA